LILGHLPPREEREQLAAAVLLELDGDPQGRVVEGFHRHVADRPVRRNEPGRPP
jgi:hypothetical protein